MKKSLIRLANKVYGATTKFPKMTSNRYFTNPIPDFDEDNDRVKVPEDRLRSAVFNITESITTNFKPTEERGEDGLYLGSAGVAYMFYQLAKVPSLSERRNFHLKTAIDYLKPALEVAKKYARRPTDVPSLLLGNCGIYVVAAAIYHMNGEEQLCSQYRQLFYEAANACKELRFLENGSDELFVGRAGYIAAALWVAKETNTGVQVQDLHAICHTMVASGREHASRHRSDSPLMYKYYNVEYLGAGHGLSSILQMLLSVPGYLESNPRDAADVQASVDYLLSLQDDTGNFPTATDEVRYKHNKLIHWCHGAGGLVYLMGRAYLVYQDDKYLKSCEKMADLVWERGLLRKGPGICHGVGGNGYVFLLLYRLTSNQKYLHRALAFAEFMETEEFKRDARVPDNPFSLYEGLSGTACFLSDLTNPSKAAFPFSDIFV